MIMPLLEKEIGETYIKYTKTESERPRKECKFFLELTHRK